MLTLGGILVSLFEPQNAKDLWVAIGPIISAALTWLVGPRRPR